MINNEELQISSRSYINKDFQTIYPELVSIVKTLTNRVNPEETNESDPFIVLLKLLGFMGDKLNYNVDKNILEAFLPSATQETSVRQLLETNGYTKRYYQSASTEISLLYQGDLSNHKSIRLEAFNTQFTDENNTVLYTLLTDIPITNNQDTFSGIVTEGTPKDLSINGNTSIQLSNLDENYRLYLPETMVAQNRIYVKNVESSDWNTSGNTGDGWSQVSNLNLYTPKSKNFKFGFDSNKNLPYIQFPDDIIELIGNGLNVKYIVTTGANGNIPRGKLTVLSSPSSDNLYYYVGNTYSSENVVLNDEINNQNLLRIFNYYASTNGSNPETIDEAYNNFKKTIGTFNTLVTPRDFANWLYMYVDSNTSYPIVSNIQVSDRRTDTTFYQPIITYNDYGVTTDYAYVHGKGSDNKTPNANTITPFDLVLYPLQQVNNYTIYNQEGELISTNYDKTFTKGDVIPTLINVLQDNQSTDHTYIGIYDSESYLYKNYYTLTIRVSTIDKVNDVERKSIVNNIKQALFDNFNSRKLDYGYEIPTDTLYSVILNSDTRIKNVFLDDPQINTKVLLANGTEEDLTGNYYIDMLARNILAGKVNLYNYIYGFNFDFSMSMSGDSELNLISDVTSLTPKLTLTQPYRYTLQENQVVQLFSNNFSNYQTATVGVNYYWDSTNALLPNKLHKIGGSEVLYLSYTNSENVKRTYEYNANSIKVYDENGWEIVNLRQTNVVNLIEPTFQLTPTGLSGTVIVLSPIPNQPNFAQLGSNQEIKFKKKNSKIFDSGTYLFYWKVNNSTNQLFPENATSIILGEDEYFMYTDLSKSSVEIFSSGTKITKNGLGSYNWTCVQTDTSELVDGDLSVYAGIDWKNITFSSDNTLELAQQTILTLTNKDIVTYNGTIDNKLTLIPNGNKFSYHINGGDGDEIKYDDLHDYQLRTRLDINCGPDLPQTLSSNNEGTNNKYTEEIDYTYGSSSQSNTLVDTTIKTNYLIQRSGNGVIDTKLSGTSEPFSVVSYTPVADDDFNINNPEVAKKQGKQYKIEFKDVKKDTSTNKYIVKVDIPRLTGCETKFMIYFSKKSDTDSVSYNYDTVEADKALNNGVNIFSQGNKNEITFTFTSNNMGTSESYIILDEVKVTQGYNNAFHLTNGQEATLKNKIDDLKGNIGFYETYEIPYAKLIDIDDFRKSEVMWDKNNVLNKFTLPQINFNTNTKIDVLKSSLK